jgi:hypothetical protein
LGGFVRTTSTLRPIPSCAHNHLFLLCPGGLAIRRLPTTGARDAKGDRAQIPAAAACCWNLRRRPWRCEPWLRVPDFPCQRAAGGACYLELSLHPVVSSLLLPAYPGGLGRLEVHYPRHSDEPPSPAASATVPANARAAAHSPLPRPVDTPPPKTSTRRFLRDGNSRGAILRGQPLLRHRSWRRVSGGRRGPSGVLACWGTEPGAR